MGGLQPTVPAVWGTAVPQTHVAIMSEDFHPLSSPEESMSVRSDIPIDTLGIPARPLLKPSPYGLQHMFFISQDVLGASELMPKAKSQVNLYSS